MLTFGLNFQSILLSIINNYMENIWNNITISKPNTCGYYLTKLHWKDELVYCWFTWDNENKFLNWDKEVNVVFWAEVPLPPEYCKGCFSENVVDYEFLGAYDWTLFRLCKDCNRMFHRWNWKEIESYSQPKEYWDVYFKYTDWTTWKNRDFKL